MSATKDPTALPLNKMPWSNAALEMQIPSFMSILGCCLVILTYISLPDLRKFRHIELVFFVAINDLFANIGTAMGYVYNDTFMCWYQGLTSNMNYLSSAMWTVVISYQLYSIVSGGARIENMTRYHIACWTFPVIVALLPLTTNTYGNEDDGPGWCFIGNRKNSPHWGQSLWEVLSFYLWLWVCILTIIGIYVGIVMKLCRSSLTASTQRTILKFSVYPCILVLCWTFNTYVNVTASIGQNGVSTGLIGTFPACQGFLNSVAFFATNKRVRLSWYHMLCGGVKPRSGKDNFAGALGGGLGGGVGAARASDMELSRHKTGSVLSGVFLASSYLENNNNEDEEDENYRPYLLSAEEAQFRSDSLRGSSNSLNSSFCTTGSVIP